MNKPKQIQIVINNKNIKCQPGQTILAVAKKNAIDIPTLCFHSDLEAKSSCRLCMVAINGKNGLFPACSTKAETNMKIVIDSPEIRRVRKINLELIFAQHNKKCRDCALDFNCQLLKLAKIYGAKNNDFSDRKKDRAAVYQFGPAVTFDGSKCIDCHNCVAVCQKQGINFLEIEKAGYLTQVIPTKDKSKTCVYCGQCIVHCPAGALAATDECEKVEKFLNDKNKIVVFQFAPAIRASLGEEFNLPAGSAVTEKLVAGIKELGAAKVFDVSVGADFTTVEEAQELIKKLATGKKLPLLTACCPAWVNFVESFYPEFIPNLTSVRSPHIILGGLIKTFWAEKERVDPKKIIVVSVMPCVSKKYEKQREKLKINGLKPVDHVLTTRELAYLVTKHKIDFQKIKPLKADDPLGLPSGAGVIYGASGGVMESALRTAYEKLTKKNLAKIEFTEVRGLTGVKKATIKINGRSIKIAVVNGLNKAKEILTELKKNPKLYDYVEVMACFGGCIGGGGQPIPTDEEIRKKRADGLYQIDTTKEIRLAHNNPIIKNVYQNFLNSEKKIHNICHTKYPPKKK